MTRKVSTLVGVAAAALLVSVPASAAPPVLMTVSHQNRHPVAMFSAPRADFATIYIASRPDRATDGSFLTENIKELDILTASEIQSGRWVDENQLDPGTYWVLLRASPDFDLCWDYERWRGYDPACADGYSNVLELEIQRPPPPPPPPPPAGRRFVAFVAGIGSGPGHRFIIGNGLYVTFRDRHRSNTRYRACWVRTDGRYRRCWTRMTGQKNAPSRIFTPAPHQVGHFATQWYVSGRVVARWNFYNGPGD